MKNNKTFEYTYSAQEQDEIEKIRKKYMPKEENKMDQDVTKPGTICSIAVGVIGCLFLGFGMSCTMVWADSLFVLGIIVGIVGIILISAAYPIFIKITAKERERIAPQILALTEELSK